TAVRYVAMHRTRDEPELVRSAVRAAVAVGGAASILLTVVTLAAAGPLAHVFGAPHLTSVLRIMALGLPFAVLETILIGATRGTGRMHGFVLVDQVMDGVLRLVLVASALALGFGVGGAAVGSTLTYVATCGAAVYVSRHLVFGRSRAHPELRGMLRFSLLQWGTVLAGTGTLWADSLLLGIWRSPKEVAAYSVATRTVTLGLVFVQPVGIAFQPIISRLHTLGDIPALRRMYVYATRLSSLAGAPPLILVAVLAAPTLTVLYGHGYERAAVPLALLALAQMTVGLTGPAGNIVTMIGRTDLTLRINVIVVAVNIGLNVILIPRYGMVGAGVAWAISVLLSNGMRVHQVWKCLRIHPFDSRSPMLGAILLGYAAVVALAAYSLDSARDAVQILIVTSIAVVTMLLAIAATDIVPIPARLRRGP
ncbi:MAG: oligosaccharide flippase family protein, partial [Gaiellales bacterium]